MAIATFSKFKKQNLLIFMTIAILAAGYCVYDGYFNESFIKKHTSQDGVPSSTLVFNQKSPPYFVAIAVLFAVRFFMVRNRKITTNDNGLNISRKLAIPFDKIQSINKTNYDQDGYFTLTYKDDSKNEKSLKLSSKTYDNIDTVLDEIISKIS